MIQSTNSPGLVLDLRLLYMPDINKCFDGALHASRICEVFLPKNVGIRAFRTPYASQPVWGSRHMATFTDSSSRKEILHDRQMKHSTLLTGKVDR